MCNWSCATCGWARICARWVSLSRPIVAKISALVVPVAGIALQVSFLVVLGVVVFVHEYGHYIVGRWVGIRAEVFSIGFGPVLFSRMDRRGTRWQVAATS